MQIEKLELMSKAKQVGIIEHQAEALWSELSKKISRRDPSRFELSSLLYFFGALIIIVSMGWFIGVAWKHFGAGAVLSIISIYMAVFIFAGSILWHKEGLQVPGGLFMTIAVCLIPLAVYSLQRWTGWWVAGRPGQYQDFVSWIHGRWFVMEMATIVGGCAALRFCRFPFLTAPIFFSVWFMSMDITPLIFEQPSHQSRLWVSMGFGVAVLISAYLTDLSSRKSREDFAFWGYLFGMFAFWPALSLLSAPSEWAKFLYCLVNIGLLFFSILLQRAVFLIFGSIGILGYLFSLFDRYFSHSTWFPVLLSAMGMALIFIGIAYHKNRYRIDSYILNLLPFKVQRWFPQAK